MKTMMGTMMMKTMMVTMTILLQCCMIRSSTVAMLLSYHTGPRPLSDALRRYFVIHRPHNCHQKHPPHNCRQNHPPHNCRQNHSPHYFHQKHPPQYCHQKHRPNYCHQNHWPDNCHQNHRPHYSHQNPHNCHRAGLYQKILSALFYLSPTLWLSTGVDIMMYFFCGGEGGGCSVGDNEGDFAGTSPGCCPLCCLSKMSPLILPKLMMFNVDDIRAGESPGCFPRCKSVSHNRQIPIGLSLQGGSPVNITIIAYHTKVYHNNNKVPHIIIIPAYHAMNAFYNIIIVQGVFLTAPPP